MHWTTILLIGIASNLDNLSIGVSFGMRSIRIPPLSNLIIAIVSIIATYSSLLAGTLIARYVPTHLANYGGSLIIIGMGLWTIKSVAGAAPPTAADSEEDKLKSVLCDPASADIDHNNVISWKEALTLGLALSLNCLASGFGAGVSGVSPAWTSLSVGVFSLVTVEIGVRAGHKIAKTWLGRYANLIAGLLLIGTGIYEIFF